MTLATASSRLVSFLQESVGDGLRGVVMYTPDAAEVMYLRADLRGQVNLRDFAPTLDQARALHEQLTTVGELQGGTLGRPAGNVSVFEHTIVFVLLYDATQGVVATLDRDVGRNLATFVDDCSTLLRADDE